MIKLALAAAALAALLIALRWFERANLYFPVSGYEGTPRDAGLAYREDSFTAEDGTRLQAWFVPARRPNATILVFFHGNAGNMSHRLDKLRIFHELGLSVAIFDYRGYGASQGRPSERGTYMDGLAAVESLSAREGVPAERTVYYGESLGCAVALETALRRPPAALILDSAFTSTVDMGKTIFPLLPVRLMVRYKYDNLSKIGRLRAPLLVLHSRQDEIVPFRMGQALFEAAPGPRKRFVETTGDHNTGFLTGSGIGPPIRAFLREFIPPK